MSGRDDLVNEDMYFQGFSDAVQSAMGPGEVAGQLGIDHVYLNELATLLDVGRKISRIHVYWPADVEIIRHHIGENRSLRVSEPTSKRSNVESASLKTSIVHAAIHTTDSYGMIAARLGVSKPYVLRIVQEAGVKRVHPQKQKKTVQKNKGHIDYSSRDRDIVLAVASGESRISISDRYGISKTRIRQILAKYKPQNRHSDESE